MPRDLTIVKVRLDAAVANLAVDAVTVEIRATGPDLTYSIVALDFKSTDMGLFNAASGLTDDRLVLLTNGQEQLKARVLWFSLKSRCLTVQPTALIPR